MKPLNQCECADLAAIIFHFSFFTIHFETGAFLFLVLYPLFDIYFYWSQLFFICLLVLYLLSEC